MVRDRAERQTNREMTQYGVSKLCEAPKLPWLFCIVLEHELRHQNVGAAPSKLFPGP